jgi:hypothetical protein
MAERLGVQISFGEKQVILLKTRRGERRDSLSMPPMQPPQPQDGPYVALQLLPIRWTLRHVFSLQ